MKVDTIPPHLSVLTESSSKFGSAPIFKVPSFMTDGQLRDWVDISYTQFAADVERVGKYWHKTLALRSLRPKVVVGLW